MKLQSDWRVIYPYIYWKLQHKDFLAQIKENGCAVCGYTKCSTALDFHHVNPEDRKFSMAALTSRSEKAILVEMEKCILLCANCHREIHNNERGK